MTMALESQMLRRIAHKLLDDVLDYAEALAEEWRLADGLGLPESGLLHKPETAPPRITLEPLAKKPPRAKPALPPPQKSTDVTISCRSSCGHLEIAVNLAAGVAKRLGLKPRDKAKLDLHGGKLRVRASKDGRAVYSVGKESTRLFFTTVAQGLDVTDKHPAEACRFQYGLEDELLIDPPTWLKPKTAMPQKPKADPPATCTKLRGTNPTIKCAACRKAPATMQCNLCPTLICNDCWEPHVKHHWQSAVTSRAPAGHAADLGK